MCRPFAGCGPSTQARTQHQSADSVVAATCRQLHPGPIGRTVRVEAARRRDAPGAAVAKLVVDARHRAAVDGVSGAEARPRIDLRHAVLLFREVSVLAPATRRSRFERHVSR